jgi:hypothetical protein
MIAQPWCFCTLALGEEYWRLTRQLAGDLARFAPGVNFLVATDNSASFADLPNVRAVHHRRKSVLGYNDKLFVISKALNEYRTAVFVDADTRILSSVDLDPETFQPGLKCYLIRTWRWVYDTHDRSSNAPQWQKDDLRIMGLLQHEFDVREDPQNIPYVVESLFAITEGKRTDLDTYLRKWNSLAQFCEQNKFFRHLGYSMGLAALLTGFPIKQHDFKGLKFFEHRLSRRIHVPNGLMTEEEFNKWNATMVQCKSSPGKTLFDPATIHALKTRARYLRIKLFGLDLLSD